MSHWHYGDIVWADLDPAAGHEQNKRRPLIVVTNDAYNAYNNLVMTIPITSDREYPLHVNIGIIPTEDGQAIHGWAEIEQAKCLDLDARNGVKTGDIDETTLDHITDLLIGGLLQPTMRIERFA